MQQNNYQTKRKKPISYGQSVGHILNDVCGLLHHKGYSTQRTDKEVEEFHYTHYGVSTNSYRIFNGIVEWLQLENQCDIDYYNHNYLAEHFPMETASVPAMDTDEATSSSIVHSQIYGGEDLDEDESIENPEAITDKQKREILKIHRNLGHPKPQELGRALRNAGCKRH